LGGNTVSVEELRAGRAHDWFAEAEVVIAVDTRTGEEEVVDGLDEWELASEAGSEEDVAVLRVELDMESGDLEWLLDAIETLESDETEATGDGFGDEVEDEE
jgi:hypothetical protein